MKQERRRYTREFKEEAVNLVNEQGYRVSEAARNLGINENMLGRWKQELSIEKEKGGTNGRNALETEITRLQKENKRLKMEREILKKAAAFFARESS